MTRKDYIALAAALAAARAAHTTGERSPEESGYLALYHAGVDSATDRVAQVLARENPRFDRARFLEACRAGFGPGEES